VAALSLTIECARDEASRWVAGIPALPGVLAYGATLAEASDRAKALALRVIADEIEHGERSAKDLDAVAFVGL
jgi:predicted RNase H-like HicB family nuclease